MPSNLINFGNRVHVMVDIETLDNSKTSVITQIGAVAFRPGDTPGTFLREFVQWVSIASCMEAGLTVSGDTIQWWFDQDIAAIRHVFQKDKQIPLKEAMNRFREFYHTQPQAKALWGHGSTFDNVIIDNAYRALGTQCPADFRSARDTRTLFDLVDGGDWSSKDGIDMNSYGPKHDGLADAKRQAVVVQRAVRTLRGE